MLYPFFCERFVTFYFSVLAQKCHYEHSYYELISALKETKKGRKKVKHIAFAILKHNLSLSKTPAISL